ncbi:GlxA family transcriptional regulator [Agaribacterium sp. ZY112]|uniref:GlxA family transcriptional regulator n=1 Tax=Agaribacterium sp. ZY112 TaxID=3233574 RepID=UPI003523ADEB
MSNLTVCFLICEHTLATSISLPIELLKAASDIARAKRQDAPRLNIQLLANLQLPSPGADIFNYADLQDIENQEHADIVFLPALWRNPFPVVKKHKRTCNWLKKMFSRETTRIAGVGTGCAFMAEAGLLNERIATTHWHFFDKFEKRYPKVIVQRNYFITQSGRLYCTGSVNTLADLVVHFIELHYGKDISVEVQRHFFHDIRKNYQQLALRDDEKALHTDELMLDAQSLILAKLSEKINFSVIAQDLGLSRRSFDRRFRKSFGKSALQWQQEQRLDNAKELLKNTNLSITEVMHEIGYSDSPHFNRLFKEALGLSPRQYRTTVRAKLFSIKP